MSPLGWARIQRVKNNKNRHVLRNTAFKGNRCPLKEALSRGKKLIEINGWLLYSMQPFGPNFNKKKYYESMGSALTLGIQKERKSWNLFISSKDGRDLMVVLCFWYQEWEGINYCMADFFWKLPDVGGNPATLRKKSLSSLVRMCPRSFASALQV